MRSIIGLLTILMAFPVLADPETLVGVESVNKEIVADRVEALGTLKANEAVELSVKVSGIIERLHFESGQRVKKGDLLVEMASAEEQAQLQEARVTVEEAAAQLQRAKTLVSRGDVSRSMLDERQREHDVARARVAAIESRLQDRRVVAPFDGVVGLRNISAGAFVGAGDIITRLIDDSRMKLDFSVPSIFLTTLQPGMAIEARARALGDQIFHGVVQSIDNIIDPVSRSITIRAIVPNRDGVLRPGLLMEVNLLSGQREALVIPELALVPRGQQAFVFVAQKDDNGDLLAWQRPVITGARWQGKVEIIDGLAEDERVVTHGTVKMRDQLLIRVQDEPLGGER